MAPIYKEVGGRGGSLLDNEARPTLLESSPGRLVLLDFAAVRLIWDGCMGRAGLDANRGKTGGNTNTLLATC